MRTRFLRRSTARGGQSRNHSLQLERARLRGKSRGVFVGALKITDTQCASPHARYIGACEKGRERQRGGRGSRGSRAHPHERLRAPTSSASLSAKCCLHHPSRHLWDAPRDGCACERADPPRGACFPSEQGLELSISPTDFMQTRPPRGGDQNGEATILQFSA